MTELMESIQLDNGLTLELFDHSRRVAGDRWLVSLFASVRVEVTPENREDYGKIRSVLGAATRFTHEQIRNFVDASEKDAVLAEMRERFLDTGLVYLSTPDFSGKLIVRKYREAAGLAPVWRG